MTKQKQNQVNKTTTKKVSLNNLRQKSNKKNEIYIEKCFTGGNKKTKTNATNFQ